MNVKQAVSNQVPRIRKRTVLLKNEGTPHDLLLFAPLHLAIFVYYLFFDISNFKHSNKKKYFLNFKNNVQYDSDESNGSSGSTE